MGDKVSFIDSVLVTVFSMVVVFVVLLTISYLINLLKVTTNKENKNSATQKEKKEENIVENHEISSVENIPDELLAVLTASIAANEGIDADKVKIRGIRKLNSTINFEDNPEELVAVIAAAIAASLGLNIPDINIKSIRRVPHNLNTWADMGRKEQLLGKL